MNTLEGLSPHLPYGLKMQWKSEDGKLIHQTLTISDYRFLIDIKHATPRCYDWDMLTKEIQISSYNNGEPFVPIFELMKVVVNYLNGCDDLLVVDQYVKWNESQGAGVIAYIDSERYGFSCDVAMGSRDFTLSIDESNNFYMDKLLLFQLLLKWHFPIGLTDYIPVTKENNPYL